MQRYHNANASYVDSFSAHCDITKGQPHKKGEGNYHVKNPDIGYKSTPVVGSGPDKGIHLVHIGGLLRISNVRGVNDERASDLFYDITFLDPVTTWNFSQFQLMWP